MLWAYYEEDRTPPFCCLQTGCWDQDGDISNRTQANKNQGLSK